ncbi:DUF3126 family protein [Sneathiella chinensis]|uniref:FERM domain-containing protein n=1 Tax=Sneathiella chinensis TaxID=349750 RepID=A0ABQ5U8G5_9PROT|nr:DUF3126 family protein [Sneathiella chinensis]GLQ08015.1 hypothetical protein GCM10007924_32370 [Sneathiella chinensis]
MTRSETLRVQRYLREKFGNEEFIVQERRPSDGSAEVLLGDEFIGVVFRDEDEGEVSFDFHMSILAMDLPETS